jgi:RNA polymerase sigma-70 factor, ECF subfamily
MHSKTKQFEALTVAWTSAQPTVAAFIHSLVIDLHDAEDVLQRVAVTLVQKCDHYDPSRPFIAWAIGFAKLEILKYLRERASTRVVFDNALVERIAESYERTTRDDWIVSQFVEECVDQLDDRTRWVIQLRYSDELKTAQIAEEMHLNDGAVRTLLCRARALLRDCLEARLARWRTAR